MAMPSRPRLRAVEASPVRRKWPVQWSGTLARVSVEVPGPLRRYGRPIRYGSSAALQCGYAEALRHRYLWHEFGNVHLLVLDPEHDTPNC